MKRCYGCKKQVGLAEAKEAADYVEEHGLEMCIAVRDSADDEAFTLAEAQSMVAGTEQHSDAYESMIVFCMECVKGKETSDEEDEEMDALVERRNVLRGELKEAEEKLKELEGGTAVTDAARVRVDIEHSAKVAGAVDAVMGRFGAEHYAGAYYGTDDDEDGYDGYETIVFVAGRKAQEMAEELRKETGVRAVRVHEDFDTEKKPLARVDIQARDGADERRIDELIAQFGAENYAGATQMGSSGNMGYETIVLVKTDQLTQFVGQMRKVEGVEDVRVVGPHD